MHCCPETKSKVRPKIKYARRGPTGLHRHPRFAKYTCIYDVQLLAIWRIPLHACSSSASQSIALRVGLMRRLPTSYCPFPFPKKTTDAVLYICTLPGVDLPLPCTCTCHLFYVQWPAIIITISIIINCVTDLQSSSSRPKNENVA